MQKKYSKRKLKEIAKKYHLADVYIFGSQVSGLSRPESDFDIAVRFKKGLSKLKRTIKTYGDLFSDLSLVFKGRKIDLIFLEEVSLNLQFRVLTEGQILYSEDLEKLADYKEYIMKMYFDFKPTEEYFRNILFQSA